jgi:hypothetical protein
MTDENLQTWWPPTAEEAELRRCPIGKHDWETGIGADLNVLVPFTHCVNCGVMLMHEPVVPS